MTLDDRIARWEDPDEPRSTLLLGAGFTTELIAALREAREDTARLDWLTAETKGYGLGWVCRDSLHGRGMRLHETSSHEGMQSTPREALDSARFAKGGSDDG